LHGQLRGGTPHRFSRGGNGWTEWDGKDASLASVLESPAGSAELDSIPSEATILAAPLVTRDDVIGIIKVAALRPTVLGDYELDLLDQFTPHASVAIHYLQQIESLKNRMLEAERKHAVANVARGVSHDVNNALGSVLPLVQQLRLEAESGEVNGALWAEDLGQIELAVQVCRRIFGNMLGFARYSADKLGQANVRGAVEGTLAILRASFERAGVAVEQHIPDDLPVVRGGQGDLEQVFLNLMSNAVTLDIVPGTHLLLFTDGISECQMGGEMFGERRIIDECLRHPEGGAGLLDAILASAARFSTARDDDQTLLVASV
jgi:two-component system, NtrC family, sensor kinase